jgi:hypothetical protein
MAEPKEGKEYPLNVAEVKLLGEYEAAIADLISQKKGALQLIVRSHALEGVWALDLSGRRLVKQEPTRK